MSNVLFISDMHFGHERIAKIRGFKNAKEQDDLIISNWNKKVHKRDLIYVLGDISMKEEFIKYLGLLKGRKILVGGNHDDKKYYAELSMYFEAIMGAIKYKGYMLTHIPIHPRELYDNTYRTNYRGNIHGHVHEKSLDDDKYYNVSVEVISYTPITLKELIKK